MSEAAQRARVVAEAERWLGTPYRARGRVRGAGVDCLTLLAEVFAAAGVVPRLDLPAYSPEWHLHRDAERYRDGLLRHAREIDGPPRPGDVALWKFGRCYSHGAIVTAWPEVIHAYLGIGCVREDVDTAPWLRCAGDVPRLVKFFSVWAA